MDGVRERYEDNRAHQGSTESTNHQVRDVSVPWLWTIWVGALHSSKKRSDDSAHCSPYQ